MPIGKTGQQVLNMQLLKVDKSYYLCRITSAQATDRVNKTQTEGTRSSQATEGDISMGSVVDRKAASFKGVMVEIKLTLGEGDFEVYCQIPETVGYVDHESFESPSNEERYYGSQAQHIDVPAWTHFPEVPEDVPTAQHQGDSGQGRGSEPVSSVQLCQVQACETSEVSESPVVGIEGIEDGAMVQASA